MKYLIIGLMVALVVGCSDDSGVRHIKLDDYKCTIAQLEAVEREYEICSRSSYFSSHCFAQAKKTQCDKVMVSAELNNRG